MIKISYKELEGLIKEYVYIKYGVVIDDTYAIDFNGTEVEIGKVRIAGPPVNIDKLASKALKSMKENLTITRKGKL